MPRVVFTPHLKRYTDCTERTVVGGTVRQALDAAFEGRAPLRAYILDDQGRLRQHVALFVDGRSIVDRTGLSDAVAAESEIYVMQALSGG